MSERINTPGWYTTPPAEEAYHCELCGAVLTDDDTYDDDGEQCDSCHEQAEAEENGNADIGRDLI